MSTWVFSLGDWGWPRISLLNYIRDLEVSARFTEHVDKNDYSELKLNNVFSGRKSTNLSKSIE